ncbi:MAG: hypothetical protein HeimC2_17830 [Candidatus Heimdallarchaeota archaeon LC_2]|nr:MAG: hypothetical protein HeimC2_17830 [Candidatus Heimdallarchaeota archaeon LC_2]
MRFNFPLSDPMKVNMTGSIFCFCNNLSQSFRCKLGGFMKLAINLASNLLLVIKSELDLNTWLAMIEYPAPKIYVKDSTSISSNNSTSRQILSKIWREVELLDDIEVLSLTYIFGAGYSIIASHVFKSSSDFITRRRLLARLIANFINPPNLHLKDWLKLLQKQNMDPVIFTFIIEGYSKLVDILFEHYLEFPQGTAKNELYELVELLSIDILDTMNFYLLDRFNLDFRSEKSLQKYFTKLMLIKELKNCRDDLLLTTFNSIKFYLKLDNQMTEDKKKFIELGKLIAKELYSEEVAIVFDLDFSLFYKTYQFQSILIEIENEILHSSSIILSATFETQIIQKISQMMDYFMNNSTRTDHIDLESYEIILYFTSEWLQYFQLSKPLYSEALMVVAPIISICFVQIARSYFENNQVQKAFLTYLNMHYFVELFIDEIKRSATWQSGSGQGAKDRNDISNRFNQLIKDWNFQELLNIKNIKEIVIDIELSLNKISSHSSGPSALSGMLEDDLIFGYIDLTKQLEDFIENDINPNIEKSVFDQLHSYDLYKRPEVNSNYRNNRMGQVLGVSEFKELPFPIIRNVHEIAIALHMFPLELSLHPFSKDSKLYQSFTKIFDSGNSDKD